MLKHRIIALAIAAAAALAAAPAAPAATATDKAPDAGSSQPVKDAYIKSKIVGALAINPHVSASKVDVKVENGVAYLGGTASDANARDLTVEIAKGIDGVKAVHSNIAVASGGSSAKDKASHRTAGETLDDATITARVKSRLIKNSSTPAHEIDVDTREGVVTLTGTVENAAQKDLAGKLAENTQHVVAVHNELTVLASRHP